MSESGLYVFLLKAVASKGSKYGDGARKKLLSVVKASALEEAHQQLLQELSRRDFQDVRIEKQKPLVNELLGSDDQYLKDAIKDARAGGFGLVAYLDSSW